MSEPEKKKTVPWQWPIEWASDEKFWRDVSSRALAGLIVVNVVAIVGFTTGVLSVPDDNPWWHLLALLTWGAVVGPLLLVLQALSANRPSRLMTMFVTVAVATAVIATIFFGIWLYSLSSAAVQLGLQSREGALG